MLFEKIKVPTFASSAIKYTAANFLNAIVPILLLPVLTAYLSKEDYGFVSIFQVLIMIVLPWVGFNSHAALEREFFNKTSNFSLYLSNCVIVILLSGGIVSLLFLFLGDSLASLTDFPAQFLWTVPVYCICHNTCEALLSTWRVNDRASAYGLFRIARTLTEIGLSIFLVVVISRGWLGRIEGMVITVLVFFGIAIFILRKMSRLSFTISIGYIKDILKFGAPLIPHTLGGVIIIYSDRLIISKMLGMAETGSYTVGYQVAMAISLLQSSFNLAWVPWFYSKLNLRDATTDRQIVRITYFYFCAILGCAILLTIAAPLIFKIFIHQTYHDSIQFVFWISLGFAFDGMYKMVVNYIFYLKKTYIISVITLLVAILNLLLNYFFIIKFRAVGASMATAVCMFLEFIIVWVISSRLYSMPWFFYKSEHK